MNDLDILIAELQKEYDYLKGEMDRCIEDWDFVGAEKFKHPLVYTRRKLDTLKSVKNPNHKRIKQLEGAIEKYPKFMDKYLKDENLSSGLKNYYYKIIKTKLENSAKELLELKSIDIPSRCDSDNLHENIEQVISGAIKGLCLILNKESIQLIVENEKDNGLQITLEGSGKYKVDDYVFPTSRKVLSNHGFKKYEEFYQQGLNRETISSDDILVMISVVIFEVFGLSGDIEMRSVL